MRENLHETDFSYYLVREDILPEALVKTVLAKQLLAHGEARTIHEAVEQVGLSRSAFYKYRDGIFPLNRIARERIVTISLDLRHRSGMLSKVLSIVADLQGNVLTINQTIPLQGVANVVMSVDTALMGDRIQQLVETLRRESGVSKVTVIGQGSAE